MTGKQLVVAFSLLFAISACIEDYSPVPTEETGNSTLVERVFSVSYVDTRTTRENGVTAFKQGDVIRYYGVDEQQVRECTVNTDGSSAFISLLLTDSESGIVAVYGGTGLSNVKASTFVLQQSSEIVPVQDGSFSGAHIAIAKANSDDGTLVFHNASLLLKFSLERNDVRRVLFFNNIGYDINSNEKQCFIRNNAAYAYSGEIGISFIPVDVAGAGEYYISIPSDAFMEGGFTIELLDGEGGYIGTVRSNRRLRIEQNQIVDLGTLDSRISSQDLIYGVRDIRYDSDTQSTITTVAYASRSGYVVSVKSDPSKGQCVTTLVYSGAEQETAVNVYSQEDGTVLAIATMDALYEIDYYEDGAQMQVTKKVFGSSGPPVVTVSDRLQNPNYNKDFTPVDAGAYEGLTPDQVLSVYDVLSPAIGLVGFLSGAGLLDVAVWVGDICNSAFGNPMIGNALMIASFYLSATALIAATGPFATCIAAIGMASFIADRINNCVEEWQNIVIQENLGDAFPTTLGYRVLSESSVELFCSVSEYVDGYVGILLADGRYINHNQKLAKQSSRTESGKSVYSFTFSGLESGKTYKYRAYLTHDDNTRLDYYKYGLVAEFILIWDMDLGLSVKWASCNLGASHYWELGDKYTLEKAKQAASKIGGGWRVPTMDESDELITHLSEYGYSRVNGIHGIYMQLDTGESVFFPIGGDNDPSTAQYWTTGESAGSSSSPNVRTFVYGRNGPSYDPGPYWASYGWLHASTGESCYVRLVRDY